MTTTRYPWVFLGLEKSFSGKKAIEWWSLLPIELVIAIKLSTGDSGGSYARIYKWKRVIEGTDMQSKIWRKQYLLTIVGNSNRNYVVCEEQYGSTENHQLDIEVFELNNETT